MRSLWKGSVSFGLVSIPVKLYSATGGHDLRFHQVHGRTADGSATSAPARSAARRSPTPTSPRATSSDDGRSAILTDDDLDALPVASGREIDVVEFVPADQVDPMLMDKTYYLEPDGKAAKPYALLREALGSTERMALVKVALRQRETLAVLRVRDQVIVLQTLLWPDEVREADFPVLNEDIDLRPQEVTMAESLVESLAADFDPTQFEDEYKIAMEQLVEAKLDGERRQRAAAGPTPTRPATTPTWSTWWLPCARASRRPRAASPPQRGEAGREEERGSRAQRRRRPRSRPPRRPRPRSRAKKTAAKKRPPRRPAAKKTAARKSA